MKEEEWIEAVRSDFTVLKACKDHQPPVYLDSACTTLVPDQVIQSLNRYYTQFPGCGGTRSRYWFAQEVADSIEGNPEKRIRGSRRTIQEFINAGSQNEIIFTLNASHAINLVALGFNFRPGDLVLLSDIEHNSNLLPWLRLRGLGTIGLDYVRSDQNGCFDLNNLEEKLKKNRVRLVSLAFTSNLTGETRPAGEIVRLAHEYGAMVFLDAAQTVPNQPVDVQKLDMDIMAFSLHKMCGPRGVGVLYCKQGLLEESGGDYISPVILGGGAVSDSTYDSYLLLDAPEKYEVGVQNYSGQIASADAVEYLQKIGLEKIKSYQKKLNRYLTKKLMERYEDTGWFKILGPKDPSERGGILTFEIRRPNAIGIAEELSDKNNVMIRDGVFCVHSYINHLFGKDWLRPGTDKNHRMTYRVSLYLYNTFAECDVFLDTLHEILEERGYLG